MVQGGAGVGEEVTLYLDTTEHRFARWLRDEIFRSPPPPYQAQDGARIYLETPRPPYLDGFASRIDVATTGTSRAARSLRGWRFRSDTWNTNLGPWKWLFGVISLSQ